MTATLIVDDVSRSYRGMTAPAVAGVSFELDPGETLAVIGESGAGKSTLGRLIAGLEQPDRGTIAIKGQRHNLRPGRVSPAQMVFQDPLDSLNPLLRISASVAEPLRTRFRRSERALRVRELLEAVGLDAARADQRSREFSGGQLQRIGLARALAGEPAVLVCDEPTSALDVSVQAQMLNLLLKLQEDRGFACVLVTHDLGVVKVLADSVIVLRQGEVVEAGDADAFFVGPRHEYSRSLLEAESEVDMIATGRA